MGSNSIINLPSDNLTQEEKEKLFRKIRVELGEPIVQVELTDEQLCVAFDRAVDRYAMILNQWAVNQQWMYMGGLPIEQKELCEFFATGDLSFENKFTNAYSKIVGLQAAGPYELKRDCITLSANTQVYQIPANREINEVIWYEVPVNNYGNTTYKGGPDGFHDDYTNTGIGNQYFIFPAFDYILAMQDAQLKSKLAFGDVVYKITGGPNGTKLLHLYPIPGGKPACGGCNKWSGCKVWYHYYDMTPEQKDECDEDDVCSLFKMPFNIPVNQLRFNQLNQSAAMWIREWFSAEAKIMLSWIRGKFSGAVKIPDAEVTLNYADLFSQGKEEKTRLEEQLNTQLEKLDFTAAMEKAAQRAEFLNKALGFHPIMYPIRVI